MRKHECPKCGHAFEATPITNADKQKAWRNRQKAVTKSNVTEILVTLPKVTAFRPPTIAEVAAHCQARRNTVDAEAFVAFYESKGWRVGAQPMKSWTAAIVTWEKRSGTRGAQRTSKPSLFDGLKAFMEGE